MNGKNPIIDFTFSRKKEDFIIIKSAVILLLCGSIMVFLLIYTNSDKSLYHALIQTFKGSFILSLILGILLSINRILADQSIPSRYTITYDELIIIPRFQQHPQTSLEKKRIIKYQDITRITNINRKHSKKLLIYHMKNQVEYIYRINILYCDNCHEKWNSFVEALKTRLPDNVEVIEK